jgi:hypothetical protein
MTNLSMYRGDDKYITLTFTLNGAVLDITGATIFLTIKNDITDLDDDAVFKDEWVAPADAESEAGRIQIHIPSSDSDSFEVKSYVFDIQYKSSTGDISTVADGNFTVNADVTRRTS